MNYFLTDHLGSVRVIVGSNGSILERNDYYPFGARHVKSDYPKSDNRLLYNGKEEQVTGNLEYLDYGARMYDSGLGRWFGGDPLSEKYLSLSPYVYGANNPVRYIDPDGRKIKDPNDLVKNYKKQVISNRYALQHMMKTGAVDAKTGEKLMSFYKNILHEISTLEKSSQVYTVLLNTSSTEGGINYDMSTGEIRIEIGDNSIGLTGHELNHAYQYENGEISFVVNNSKYGQLYDISDETNAYNRERALGTGMQFFQMPNVIYNGYPFKMENNDVRDLGKSMTPPAYQTLPNGPIDINSKEGKALRERTRQTGSLGDSVYEVYKGWQKDYRKKRKK